MESESNLKPQITVIFDRSALHGENFAKLVGSGLLDLTKRNIVRVHHTHIFLEETLGMYEKERNRKILIEQMPFILDICNGKWFQAREEIWDVELIRDGQKRANVFVSADERRNTEVLLRKRLSDNSDFPELTDGFAEKHAEREKQGGQFKFFSSLRDEVANLKTKIKSPTNRVAPLPLDFIKAHIDDVGFELIKRQEKVTDPHALYRKWRLNKKLYPFFTGFVQGYLYSAYFAMVEAGNGDGKRIDRNSQPDIEQLTYLSKADLLVSCDQRFMLDAFNVLWKTKEKKIMTTDEFLLFLTSLK